MPSTTFYPSLSTLIPLENIPNELGSFKNGLTNIFSKLYYNDLQIHKSSLGDAAFYNLKIVTYKRIALEIGGANGLSLILNPSLDENIAGAISEFNVSLSYKWEILKYVKDFDLQSFDYSGAAIFNLIVDFTGLNKQKLLSEAIFLFIEDPDPIQKFVDDFNANPTYNPTTLLVPISDPDVEVVISDLLDQLIANGNDFNAYEIVFESFLYNTNSFGDVFDKVEILFQKWLGAFTIQDLKNLLIPQATASFNIDFGLEFPISILRQVNVLGQPLLDPLTQKDIPAILVCSGGSFSFNSKNGFLFQPDYALSFINYAEIKGTGLYFTFTNAKIDLSKTTNIEEAMLDGRPMDFMGVYIQDAIIKFPTFWNADSANEWKIIFIDIPITTTKNENDIKINLRIDDNTKPILFLENTEILEGNRNAKFLGENEILNGTAIDWSKDLTFKFPNTGTNNKENIAFYLKLQYFRQIHNVNTIPTTLGLQTQSTFKSVFASLDTKNLGDTDQKFWQVSNEHFSFIQGALPDGNSFSGVAVQEANFDTNRIILHTQMLFPRKTTGYSYLRTDAEINEGFSLEGNSNQMSFLRKDIYSYSQSIQENSTSPLIKLLDIAAWNGFTAKQEDLFILGLMQTELLALKNVTGLSNLHARYIGFEDVSSSPAVDINGTPYKKYKLNVQGLNASGLVTTLNPSSNIFVFTGRGFVFTSKNFADAELQKQQIKGKCPKCSDEFTTELIRKTLNKKELNTQQQTIISSIIPYLNKYRQNLGLDTCLRKAHFIAQIALECKSFTTFEESANYSSENFNLGVFSTKAIIIDSIIVNSLKDYLSSIFKLIDGNGIEIIKSNDDLSTILITEKPLIINGELYGRYEGGDKLIKQVYNANNSMKYKIFIKNHPYFDIPLMSRAYAPYIGDIRGLVNGGELTRDGWKFKGRGLKQVTGRGNYLAFSTYRNSNPFPDDSSGAIDFTQENPVSMSGKYLMISQDPKFATQSAIWFWNNGNRFNKKTAKEPADIDNVDGVSKTINPNDVKSFPLRSQFYSYAKLAFDVLGHKEHLKL